MHVRFDANHTPPGPGEEHHVVPGTPAGLPFFSRQYRYWVAITPGATELANHSDGIMVSADATVTMAGADDPATTMAVPLKAGVQYDLACSKVTVVSTGTAYALYHRKPAS